jgi:murein DD-endopeptidase MepM/ murein hydrolase activator NlpD
MYLHMSPKALAAAGMKKGKKVPVARGRVIGKVGNYLMATPSDTTAHLHFEIRRLQGDIEAVGPSLSPYMTLVRAYERLIGASGKELP